jgi:lipoprotein signal peptidase
VRDFLKVDLGFWPLDPWPVFNFADSCISIGFVLLVLGVAKIQLKGRGEG